MEKVIKIDDIEYEYTDREFELIKTFATCYAVHCLDENNHNIRVYNHHTKEHYYLERADLNNYKEGLLFVNVSHRHSFGGVERFAVAVVNTWAYFNPSLGEFIKYDVMSVNKSRYCMIKDNFNTPLRYHSHSADYFYKINSITKGE